MRNGKREEAIADFEAALKFDPTHDKAKSNLAGARGSQPQVMSPAPKLRQFPEIKEMLKVPEFSAEEGKK